MMRKDIHRSRHPEFRKALETVESQLGEFGKTLEAYLVCPMQRITRYPMMVEAIRKATSDPEQCRRVDICSNDLKKVYFLFLCLKLIIFSVSAFCSTSIF